MVVQSLLEEGRKLALPEMFQGEGQQVGQMAIRSVHRQSRRTAAVDARRVAVVGDEDVHASEERQWHLVLRANVVA